MFSLLAFLVLSASPDQAALTALRDQLFHHSDVRGAVVAADKLLERTPQDPDVLDLAIIAHAAVGDPKTLNALAVRRAETNDAHALPPFLFALRETHATSADASLLREAALKLLPKLNAAQAAPLRVLIGRLDRALGKFDLAQTEGALAGQIVDWQIVGPFENDQGSGFDNAFAPEHGVNLAETYLGKVGPVRWRPLLGRNWNGTLCVSCAVAPNEGAVAYLVTWVKSTRDTDAALWGTTDGKLKVWVNGYLAATDRSDRRAEDGQTRAGIRLHEGWNQILVKVARRSAGWSVGLRLTNPEGESLDGLQISTDAHDFKKADVAQEKSVGKGQEKWPKEPEDAIVALLPTNKAFLPAAYFKAWRLNELGHARDARIAFEELVDKGPKCGICLAGLADTTLDDEDPDRALTALADAFDDDPGYARAALAQARIHMQMGFEHQAEVEAEAAVSRNGRDDDALALLSELRLKRGFAAEAHRLADAAVQAFPGWAPHLLEQAKATQTLGDYAKAEALMRQAIDSGPANLRAMEVLTHFLTTEGRPAEAAKLFEAWLAHEPGQTHLIAQLGEAQLLAGDDDGVRAQVAAIRELSPDAASADRLEGDLLERRGDRASALASFERALAHAPSDSSIRDHIELLRTAPAVDPNEKLQISSDDIRRTAIATLKSSYPGTNAVVLLKEITSILHEDGSERYRVHFAVKTFDRAGIERYINFNVGKHHNLKIERAGTYDEAGEFHQVSSIDEGVVHFISGRECTFEIAFTADSPPRSGTQWWDMFWFQDQDRALQERWIIQHPTDRPLKTWRRSSAVTERHEARPNGEVIIFEARNEPALVEEPGVAPEASFRDVAMASSFQTWDGVVTWIRASVDDQLALDVKDPKVQELARQIVSRAKTLDEKVAALAFFVRHDIHYNQADTDIYRWRAHPARRILQTHYGDCKDKATLFLALAKNVGIVAEDAVLLVNFFGTTPTEIPTLFFDHAVAFLPRQPGLTHPGLLDLTADEFGTGSVPFGDQLANALVFSPGGAGYRFERIPVSSPENVSLSTTLKVELQAKGRVAGTITTRAHGNLAGMYRYFYRDSRRREEFLDARLNGDLLPGAKRVGKETITGLDEPERDVELTAKVEAEDLVRATSDGSKLPIGGMPKLDVFTRETSRTEPLRLGAPHEITVHRTVVLPKELAAKKLPANVKVDGPYFFFELISKQVDANTVSVDTRFQSKAAEVAPEQFPAFQKAALEVERASDVTLALGPRG